jgi:hypothetical protein
MPSPRSRCSLPSPPILWPRTAGATIPVHAFAALPVVIGAYWIANRMRVVLSGSTDLHRNADLRSNDSQHAYVAAIVYTWVAAGLVVWGLK